MRLEPLDPNTESGAVLRLMHAKRLWRRTRRGREYPLEYREPPCNRPDGRWWIPCWCNGAATTLYSTHLSDIFVSDPEGTK